MPDAELQRLWEFLSGQPALAGFVLIGGTALEVQLHHRVSHDLDLAWREARLPRERIEAVLTRAREAGLHFERNDQARSAEEFEIAGMDLRDYQQDFLVDGTAHVTFFCLDESAGRLLAAGSAGGVRVSSLAEMFKLKSLLCADRSKSRDWFDLYALMTRHGFTLADARRAFEEAGVPGKFDLALDRLCRALPQESDEGFQSLWPDPPSLAQLRSFFEKERARYERSEAARAAGEKTAEPDGSR